MFYRGGKKIIKITVFLSKKVSLNPKPNTANHMWEEAFLHPCCERRGNHQE
jgi:hypothetical protein